MGHRGEGGRECRNITEGFLEEVGLELEKMGWEEGRSSVLL